MAHSLKLIKHYQKYFYTIKANTPGLRKQVHHLRYKVFIEEFGYIFGKSNSVEESEMDNYDDCAQHVLLFYRPTNQPIGYIRLIAFRKLKSKYLPIEEYGKDSFDLSLMSMDQLRTGNTGEISRMALVSSFRRRPCDTSIEGGNLNQEKENDKRRFKVNYLPVALTLAGLNLMFDAKLEYVIAMMEKRLAILLKSYGVQYNQIGRTIDYYGKRSPYMMYTQKTYDNLAPEFQHLFTILQKELNCSQHK